VGEGFWGRQEILVQAGWNSFMPAFHLREAFCDKELIDLERKASAGGAIYAIGYGAIFLDPEAPLMKELAEKRVVPTMSPCDGRLKQFMVNDTSRYLDFIKPFEEELRKLRSGEIERHSIGLYKKYDETPPSRLKLYKAVMKERARKLGFTFDKGLSTSHSPIFSKDFISPWRLCIRIEPRELRWTKKPGPQLPPAMHEWRPWLSFQFGLVHQENRGAKDSIESNLLFECGWFSPIAAYPFHHCDRHFESLEELEVIILFHLKMYSLIQEDFEKCLYKGLDSALSTTR
jgi:hypothetical protein